MRIRSSPLQTHIQSTPKGWVGAREFLNTKTHSLSRRSYRLILVCFPRSQWKLANFQPNREHKTKPSARRRICVCSDVCRCHRCTRKQLNINWTLRFPVVRACFRMVHMWIDHSFIKVFIRNPSRIDAVLFGLSPLFRAPLQRHLTDHSCSYDIDTQTLVLFCCIASWNSRNLSGWVAGTASMA